jgi:hypothetical protein
LLAVAALAVTVATTGFVLPAAADLGTRVAGAAVYTAWGAIAVLPALVLAAAVCAWVRRGIATLSA